MSFWEDHVVKDESGCWLWTGYLTDDGYGRVGSMFVHKIAYAREYGNVPSGYMVDHICRVRRCVRPTHLRAATNKQNQENQAGPRGSTYLKSIGRYRAQVRHNGKLHTFGSYPTREEAEAVAAAKRCELFTHNEEDR